MQDDRKIIEERKWQSIIRELEDPSLTIMYNKAIQARKMLRQGKSHWKSVAIVRRTSKQVLLR